MTGLGTNSVEGMHSVMKRDSRVQFCRLPSVKAERSIGGQVEWREASIDDQIHAGVALLAQ